MSFKKGFLQPDNKIFILPKHKVIIGIFLFVTVAFSGYFMMQIFRESFRIFAGTLSNNNLPIFSKEVTYFFNFFFAFIASLSAQSLVFVYWYEHPKFFLSRNNYKRTIILHDHRFTIWYFIFWFVKIGMAIGFLSLFSLIQDLHNDFSYIFYLIALVLFLQVWSSFRLYLKKKSIKWIVLSFLVLVSSSFILSNINTINYDKINQDILNLNPYYKYNIHIPKSKDFEPIFYSGYFVNIFIIPKINTDDSINILLDDEVINSNNLEIEFKLRRINKENNFVFFHIHADKSTKIKYINQFKEKILQLGFHSISYAVRTEDLEQSTPFYYIYENVIPHVIINDTNKKEFLTKYPITIKLNSNLELLIDGIKTDVVSFEEILKLKIQNQPKYSIVFQYNNERTYEEYLKVVEKINYVIQTLNEEDKKSQLGPNSDIIFERNYQNKYYTYIIETPI